MARLKLIWLGKQNTMRRALLESLRATSNFEIIEAGSFDDLAQQAKGNLPVALLLEAEQGGPALPGFLTRLAHVIGPMRLPVLLVAETEPTPEQAQYQRQQGVAGTVALARGLDLLPRQIEELIEEAWFAGQFANLQDLGGEEFVHEMIDLFLDLTPQKFTEARQTLAAGDWVSSRRAIHSIKSSAANLGAVRLWREAAIVEDRLATQEQPEQLPPLFDQLAQTYQQVKTRLLRRKEQRL